MWADLLLELILTLHELLKLLGSKLRIELLGKLGVELLGKLRVELLGI